MYGDEASQVSLIIIGALKSKTFQLENDFAEANKEVSFAEKVLIKDNYENDTFIKADWLCLMNKSCLKYFCESKEVT